MRKHESGVWSVCERDGGKFDQARIFSDGTMIEMGKPWDTLMLKKID
jgi:hypothetical protein